MLSPTTSAQFFKKLPGPLYRFLAKRWIDYEYPRHIFIELTSRCNLVCSNCPRPRISRDLSYRLFTKVVDESSCYGKRSFSLHLFGEPLLYPKIIEAVRYLKRFGHTVVLTTNGTLLGRFYKCLRSVDKIIWSYKPNVKVPEELRSWKNFTVRFFDRAEDESWKRREIRGYHNYGGKLSSGVPSTESRRYPCYHLFLAPGVRANGDIVICCADPAGESVIGNIASMTIAEAWKRMGKLRTEHLNGVYSGICTNCDVWKSYPSLF